MEYQRRNLYQAVQTSHAHSQTLEAESEVFKILRDEAQKYADKAGAEIGQEIGLQDGMSATRKVTDESGQTVEVPEFRSHPLAGFTSYGDAYNKAAEVAYEARTESDFIQRSAALENEYQTDLQGFDEAAGVFEEAYFEGMRGKEAVIAKATWAKYKTAARGKVQTRAQEANLARSVADIDRRSFLLKADALRRIRAGDFAEANEQWEKYFQELDKRAALTGDYEEAEKQKQNFLIERERQQHLRIGEERSRNGSAIDYIMGLYDYEFNYLDAEQSDQLIKDIWAMDNRFEAERNEAEEQTTKQIKLNQDALHTQYMGIVKGVTEGQVPHADVLSDMVRHRLLRQEQAVEILEYHRVRKFDGVDNPTVVNDLEERLYLGDIPTDSEMIGYKREGYLARKTFDDLTAKIHQARTNPKVIQDPRYKMKLGEIDAAFGIKAEGSEAILQSLLGGDPDKAMRRARARGEYFERVLAGEDYAEAAAMVIGRWTSPKDLDKVNSLRPNEASKVNETLKALEGAGIPMTSQELKRYMYGDFANP